MVGTSSIILSPGDNLTVNPYAPQLRKTFPSVYNSQNDRIGLQSLSIYYSWLNVTQNFNNRTFGYVWTDGVTYPIFLVEGFYQTQDLNNILQQTMQQNGHYLLDASMAYVYYLSFVVNVTYYGVTLTSTATPTSLPTGYTNPSNMALNGKAPQLVINPDNFGKLIGFPPGTYPAIQSSTTTQVESPAVPQPSPITCVNVLCDFVNDTRFTSRASCIATFVPQVAFGHLISFNPPILSLYDVSPRQYSGVSITFVDQNYIPLQIVDTTQVQVNLILEHST
jgi:hypothetical protein